MEFNQEVKKNNYAIKFFALENGIEIGRAYLCLIFNDLHQEPYGLLEDVFVNEDFRSSGIGTKLLQQIIQEAKKLNCYKLIADSRLERENVHKWYLKNGFKEYGKEFRMDFK